MFFLSYYCSNWNEFIVVYGAVTVLYGQVRYVLAILFLVAKWEQGVALSVIMGFLLFQRYDANFILVLSVMDYSMRAQEGLTLFFVHSQVIQVVCVDFCEANLVCSHDFDFEELLLVALHSLLIHVFANWALTFVVIHAEFRGRLVLAMVYVEFDCTSGIAP